VAFVFRLPVESLSVGGNLAVVSSTGLDVYKFLIGATFAVWFVIWTTSFVPIHRRTGLEDQLLEKTFGKEYKAWRERTPCRYIPGII
jgi:protein-S-isoprenylcysteine O-methyltransferase Ste14